MLRCATKTVFLHMVFLARIYRVGIHRVYTNKMFFLKKWLSTRHPVTHLAKSLLECTSKFKMIFFTYYNLSFSFLTTLLDLEHQSGSSACQEIDFAIFLFVENNFIFKRCPSVLESIQPFNGLSLSHQMT